MLFFQTFLMVFHYNGIQLTGTFYPTSIIHGQLCHTCNICVFWDVLHILHNYYRCMKCNNTQKTNTHVAHFIVYFKNNGWHMSCFFYIIQTHFALREWEIIFKWKNFYISCGRPSVHQNCLYHVAGLLFIKIV